MKRLLILLAVGFVAVVTTTVLLYGPKTSKAQNPPGTWSVAYYADSIEYDDDDPVDDVYRVAFSYTVPSGETGAYLEFVWNNDTTTTGTVGVDAGTSGHIFSWAVGEYGNGCPDIAYFFKVNLCDEDDNIMATSGEIERVFLVRE